ncbi:type 1 glutamine amidotransferase domain-containing protein [Sphingobacterium deserti]|uniref:ThiJ/PfpI domain-containing protein n=1 Tax=Sphingobacterium deserti TaxID=1229276 RepID=A0A0B8SZM9_9SPHI|nr:type 1 glutamine amidotransferase domain-containing protein [Sphingobacterium deserti]KGE13357.1 ThiJ/PfpI domain-containing protein [Sphingobacterium deserti]
MAHRKVLIILTSHQDMIDTDSKTGVWLGEFTDPYYAFKDAGYEITLASPKGGTPPIDPLSKLTENVAASNKRFQKDEEAQLAFASTEKVDTINPAEFDTVFVPGGHGPLWDLAENIAVGRILTHCVNESKIIGAVCHGPAALFAIEANIFGYLRGKKITAFSNLEENMVLRAAQVPYLLETRLREHEADLSLSKVPFMSHVLVDENLVTGQNPLSALPTAKKVIELVQKHYVSSL